MADPLNPNQATPQGKPDERPLEAWLLLALIRPGDVEAAHEMYVQLMPRAFRGLADHDGFHFDEPSQMYLRDGTDKPVSARTLKYLSLLIAMAVAHELEDLAQYVATGKMPLDEWQREAAARTKDLFILQAALAAGGFDRLTDAVRTEIMGTMEGQTGLNFSLDRLANFTDEIAAGADRVNTVAGIMNRAALYGFASNPVYERVRRFRAMGARDDRGRPTLLWERNVLGEEVQQHCGECPELTAQGWVPIGTLPPVGTRFCQMGCACTILYSPTGPA